MYVLPTNPLIICSMCVGVALSLEATFALSRGGGSSTSIIPLGVAANLYWLLIPNL
jgi:hypothetical protein